MVQDSLPIELILNESRQSLGKVYFDETPQPGTYVNVDGQTYAVLERHHRYCLKANRYTLHKVTLYVKPSACPNEVSEVGDRTVIGDATCAYNAHSELMRCAVNPAGPCQGCKHYQAR